MIIFQNLNSRLALPICYLVLDMGGGGAVVQGTSSNQGLFLFIICPPQEMLHVLDRWNGDMYVCMYV